MILSMAVGYVSWQRSRLQFNCIIKDTIKHSNLIAHIIRSIFRANRAAYSAPPYPQESKVFMTITSARMRSLCMH